MAKFKTNWNLWIEKWENGSLEDALLMVPNVPIAFYFKAYGTKNLIEFCKNYLEVVALEETPKILLLLFFCKKKEGTLHF